MKRFVIRFMLNPAVHKPRITPITRMITPFAKGGSFSSLTRRVKARSDAKSSSSVSSVLQQSKLFASCDEFFYHGFHGFHGSKCRVLSVESVKSVVIFWLRLCRAEKSVVLTAFSRFIIGALLFPSTLNPQLSTVFAQGTAFTYQGRLNDSGGPANGIYDLRFTIYDLATGGSALGGPITSSDVGVVNGLFSVTLDFGAGVFTGEPRWLKIAVRESGGGSFTTLDPRLSISAVPYALYALTPAGPPGDPGPPGAPGPQGHPKSEIRNPKEYSLGLLMFVFSASSHAQPFSIDWHMIGGGGGTSTGGAFSLRRSIGQPEAEVVMTGGNLSLTGGFWNVDANGQTPDAPVTPTVRHTWTGTVSGNWSEPRNWSPATVPDVDDPILFPFPGTAANRMITNDLPARVVGDITFGGHNFEISGHPVILGGKTITVAGTASNIIHLDIVLAGPVTIKAGGSLASKQLMLRGKISLGSHGLSIVNDGDVICSGVISGTGGLSKSDQGKLVFSGASANTYSGATVISEGTFELNESGVIAVPGDLHLGSSVNSPVKATAVHAAPDQIADHATVFVLRTGELRLNNFDETIRKAELSSGKITTGSGMFTVNHEIICARGDVVASSIAGKLNLAAETTVVDVQADAVLVISAVIGSGPANAELRKNGLGELQLSASNSYTARTRVTDGTLRASASGDLGGSKDVLVEGGRLALVNSIIDGKKLVASEPGTIATEGPASSWNGPVNLTGTVDIDTPINSSLLCSAGSMVRADSAKPALAFCA